MSNNPLLTEAELAAIAERDKTFRQWMSDKKPTSTKEIAKLLGEIAADRAIMLADLHRYRDWCRRLLRAYDGEDDLFALQAEVRAALEEGKAAVASCRNCGGTGTVEPDPDDPDQYNTCPVCGGSGEESQR